MPSESAIRYSPSGSIPPSADSASSRSVNNGANNACLGIPTLSSQGTASGEAIRLKDPMTQRADHKVRTKFVRGLATIAPARNQELSICDADKLLIAARLGQYQAWSRPVSCPWRGPLETCLASKSDTERGTTHCSSCYSVSRCWPWPLPGLGPSRGSGRVRTGQVLPERPCGPPQIRPVL